MWVMRNNNSVTDGHQKEELLYTFHMRRDGHIHTLKTTEAHVGQFTLQSRLKSQVLHNLHENDVTFLNTPLHKGNYDWVKQEAK